MFNMFKKTILLLLSAFLFKLISADAESDIENNTKNYNNTKKVCNDPQYQDGVLKLIFPTCYGGSLLYVLYCTRKAYLRRDGSLQSLLFIYQGGYIALALTAQLMFFLLGLGICLSEYELIQQTLDVLQNSEYFCGMMLICWIFADTYNWVIETVDQPKPKIIVFLKWIAQKLVTIIHNKDFYLMVVPFVFSLSPHLVLLLCISTNVTMIILELVTKYKEKSIWKRTALIFFKGRITIITITRMLLFYYPTGFYGKEFIMNLLKVLELGRGVVFCILYQNAVIKEQAQRIDELTEKLSEIP